MINVQQLLQNTVVLSYTMKKWGNSRKADKEKIQTDSDKSRLKLSKELIECDEYAAITSYQGQIRQWLNLRAVPSFFRDALMLVKIDMTDEVERYLQRAQQSQVGMVEQLIVVYPERKEDARRALNGLYNEDDYPAPDKLRDLFAIKWNWIALGVPETLPDTIRQQENAKLQNLWEESIQEIIKSLREGFKELVDHAVDRLTVRPGEKPKVFRDTFVTNFKAFLDTFSARNIVNDTELARLVDNAKDILRGITADELRQDISTRNYVARKFTELKAVADESVMSISRKFDFGDMKKMA